MNRSPQQVKVVDAGLGPRVQATLALVARALEDEGWKVERVRIPAHGLPRLGGTVYHQIASSFTETPAALIESWRIARHLDVMTVPGDIVLLPDRDGVAGVFALEEAMRAADDRRSVLVTAADGRALEYLAISGTYDGVPEDAEFAIDWELVAYRFATSVLATSERAIRYLAGEGVVAQLVSLPMSGDVGKDRPRRSKVWLPEIVSRLSQSATLLRALNIAQDEVPDLEVLVSDEDEPDVIWKGSTWDAIAAMRVLLGETLHRTGHSPDPDVVILGDPFAVPNREIEDLRTSGVSVLVPEGSTAASRWPDATTWTNERDLAEAVVAPPAPASSNPIVDLRIPTPRTDPNRARKVSVAVPVFRDVAYLDECIRSIVAQDDLPHELILVDDGSRSADVTATIGAWCDRHPELISSLSQPNQGVCVARNLALDSMTGDAFLLVDADDVLDPRFIGACAEALRANPRLWAVATWTEFFGDYNGIEAKPPFDRRVGSRENPIISTCVLVDMQVRDLGIRFEPDLAYLYCEDWDVWSKLVAAGGSFGLVPEPLARHRVSPGQGAPLRTDLAHSLGKARATWHLTGIVPEPVKGIRQP